jgi:hypothetical protein
MKTVIFSLLIFLTPGIAAQNGLPGSAGARGLGMGGTGLNFHDINSAFSNPAGLAHLAQFSAMAAVENRFLTSEIQHLSAAAVIPAGGGNFGLTVQYFGFEGFNEQKVGLAYSRRLSEGISLGAQFFYFGNRIPDYGARHLLNFEAGLQAAILPSLHLAARVHNPVRQEITEGEFLPTLFETGLAYTPSEKLLIVLEMEKDIDFPARVKSGLEYRLAEPLRLRIGVASNPVSYGFGIGIELPGNIKIDVASNYHQILGFSPAFSLLYQRADR